MLPTPKNIMGELTRYNFLWKGKDKVTRASAINNYEGRGIKMIDIESMISSPLLAQKNLWRQFRRMEKLFIISPER